MIKKLKIYCFLVFLSGIVLVVNAYSQEKSTNFYITAGLGANGNLYSSSFKELPGFPTCCTDFNSGFGIGPTAMAGLEYEFTQHFLGGRLRLQAAMGYSSLSANFNEKEFKANVITGNSSRQLFEQYIIKPSINTIFIDPAIVFYPFERLPIGFKAGFQVHIPLTKNFNQEDKLVDAQNVTFSDGTTIDNSYNGKIPGASPALMFLALGVRYELYSWKNFIIMPELNYGFGLNNFAESLNWKASFIKAGVSISYNIRKTAPPPPLPPPAPPMPEPPAPKPLFVNLDISHEGIKLGNESAIDVKVKDILFITKYSVIPVVFYKKDEQLNETDAKAGSFEDAQNKSIKYIIQYLRNNPDVNVEINYSGLDDEESSVHSSRLDNLAGMISRNNIAAGRVYIRKEIFSTEDKKVKEREDEFRSINFSFSDNNKILYAYGDTTISSTVDSIGFNIAPNISEGAEPIAFNGKVSLGNNILSELKRDKADYRIDGKTLEALKQNKDGEILIDAEVKDAEGKENNVKTKLKLKPVHEVIEVHENIIDNNDAKGKYNQFILGYNSFDKADMFAVDNEVINKIRYSLVQGKKVEILPLTDNIGEEEHNSKLARSRAAEAVKLLGGNNENLTITYPENYIFPNENPWGRVLNRCVLVRIRE